jgi:anti-sigma-K factor RskA
MLFGPLEKKKGLIARLGLLGPVIGGVIGAVVVLAVLDRIGFMQDPAQTYVAELTDDLDTFVVQARFDPASNQLDLTRTAGGPREWRALEMWLIAGDNAPVSLGVWPKGQANAVLDIPADLALQMAGGVLAVSDEPEGGSGSMQHYVGRAAIGRVGDPSAFMRMSHDFALR